MLFHHEVEDPLLNFRVDGINSHLNKVSLLNYSRLEGERGDASKVFGVSLHYVEVWRRVITLFDTHFNMERPPWLTPPISPSFMPLLERNHHPLLVYLLAMYHLKHEGVLLGKFIDVEHAKLLEVDSDQIVLDDCLFVLKQIGAVAVGDFVEYFGLVLGQEGQLLMDNVDLFLVLLLYKLLTGFDFLFHLFFEHCKSPRLLFLIFPLHLDVFVIGFPLLLLVILDLSLLLLGLFLLLP